MAKTKEKSSEVDEDIFNPYAEIDDVLDDIEKDYGLISTGMDKNEKRLSTGLLVLDLIMGKGVAGGGWYTLFGGESCAKSTTATTIMANSVNSEVPIIQLWDYEGSSEPNYLENILKAQGIKVPVDEIFGIRNPETSKYVVKPRVRLYNESIAEKFFDSVAKLQRLLPDKLKFGDDWFYVYAHTKENIALLKGKYDKSFYQKTGKMRVPAENGMPQALLLVDSYPAMLPEGQDVDDPKSAMAMQARMFSEQIKRVKGKMKSKRITVVGMNQLREKPMVMYGCNHASNIITFEDGSIHTIKDVVNNRIRGNVLSYSEDYQTFEYKPITGWHYNGEVEAAKDWVVIVTDTGSQIVLTRDHEVLTSKGWYKAIDLKLTSRLYNGNTLDSEKPKYVTIKSLTVGYDESFDDSGKYDITVKDNHNYIAGNNKGIIVHNSPFYESGGQALKFYCFSSDTLLITDSGIIFPREVPHTSPNVLGENGIETPTMFDSFGESEIFEAVTDYGYTVKGKSSHRVKIAGEQTLWKQLDELQPNDKLYVYVGSHIFGNLDEDSDDINIVRKSTERVQVNYLSRVDTSKCSDAEIDIIHIMLLNIGYIINRDVIRTKKLQYILDTETFIEHKVVATVKTVKTTAVRMTYDFHMPDTHTVVTNGIISHNSDCRVQVSARSNIYGKGAVDEEPSYDGNGTDKYRYIHAKATKNKLSTPYLEGMMRVWIEDSTGQARGFDPVFDTYQYLLTTGQIVGKRNSMKLLIPQLADGKAIKWNDFKTLVLGNKKEQLEVFERMGSVKPLNIRKFCQKQLESGDGMSLFFENFKKAKPDSADD